MVTEYFPSICGTKMELNQIKPNKNGDSPVGRHPNNGTAELPYQLSGSHSTPLEKEAL